MPIDTYYAFYDDPYAQGAGDLALTRAAAYVFAKRRPALTALHLLVTDKAQHEFGPAHYLSARCALDGRLLRGRAAPGGERRRPRRSDDVRDWRRITAS